MVVKILVMVSASIVILLLSVQIFLSSAGLREESMLSSLESGFESNYSSKLISSSFFFLAILFVLFDLELVMLFPGVLLFLGGKFSYFVLLMMFIVLTLFMEWLWCGFKWQV